MPGHDALAGLTQDQKGVEFEGPFITIGEGEPSNTTNTGISRGGLYIRTDSGLTTTTLYCNRGTAETPDWSAIVLADI